MRVDDQEISISLTDALNRQGAGLGNTQATTEGNFLWIFRYDKTLPTLKDVIMNRIIEAFAGPHDFGNKYWGFGYDPSGITAQNQGFGQLLWSNFVSIVNIPIAAPFALSTLVTPEFQTWLNDNYYRKDGK